MKFTKTLMMALTMLIATTALSDSHSELVRAGFTVLPANQEVPSKKEVLQSVTLTERNTLSFRQYFYDDTVGEFQKKLQEMNAALPAGEPIYLVIGSGGGSIDAGLEMIDMLNGTGRVVHTITNYAYSMGFETVQAVSPLNGGKRLIIEGGGMMSHRARGGVYGEYPNGSAETRFEYQKSRVLRMDEIAVARTNGKHTLESYRKLIQNEYWCEGQSCVDGGFADQVVSVSCDHTLSGTVEDLNGWMEFMFMRVEFIDTWTKCPLSTRLLDSKITIDGRPAAEVLREMRKEAREDSETDSADTKSQELERINSLVRDLEAKAAAAQERRKNQDRIPLVLP